MVSRITPGRAHERTSVVLGIKPGLVYARPGLSCPLALQPKKNNVYELALAHRTVGSTPPQGMGAAPTSTPPTHPPLGRAGQKDARELAGEIAGCARPSQLALKSWAGGLEEESVPDGVRLVA